MAFELKDRDLQGRIGRIRTKSGVVTTPAFMPVINPMLQVISPSRMKKEFGCEIIITNSYIIRKTFGHVPDLEVHRLLGYDGVVMTDSGAYQILVYGGVEVTQPQIIDYQKRIGSDIAVILDIPTGWDVPRNQVEYTVDETIRREEQAQPLISDSKALWVGPVQGGRHLDLVAKSAKSVGAMPYHIHALGSPTEVMERYMFSVLVDMIITAKRNLPPDRPLHLFGAGHPMMMSLAVALGCDLFDSASYAIYAKDDRYMTVDGTQRLEFLNYLPCACPVCRGHTIQDLREATKSERELMLAEHNLHACMAEIETIKQAISEGSLWDLVERRARSHPSLTSALNQMSKYAEWLEEGSPSFKGHGVFYYDYHSISKPEVTRHRNQLIGNYMKPNNSEVLLLVTPPSKKPFTSSDEHSALRRKLEHEFGSELEKFHICFYAAPYGVIPEDLCETYPLSQFECSQPLDLETIRITANSVASYAKQSGHNVVYLYRANGQLEDEVESQLMYELNESKVNFISIWSCDPWSIDSLNTLTKTLGERR